MLYGNRFRASMRMPRVPASVLVALLAGLTVSCADSVGPDRRVVPNAIEIIAGDRQSAVRGASFELPLTVRVLGSEGQRLPGETVRWTLVSGEATLASQQSVTNGGGVAEVMVRDAATVGPVVVSATVRGVAPATFSLTGVDPCSFDFAPRIAPGSSRSGTLAPLDCTLYERWIHDLFRFTLYSQTAVRMSVRSATFDPAVMLDANRNWYLTVFDTADATRDARFKAILPAGTYGMAATSEAPLARGEYEISLSWASENVESCEFAITLVGITTTQNLAPTDCAGSAHGNEDVIGFLLLPGEGLKATESSTAFAPYLQLTRGSVVLAEQSAGTTGNATIEYVADRFDLYWVHASSELAGRTGAYTLTTAYSATTISFTRRWALRAARSRGRPD